MQGVRGTVVLVKKSTTFNKRRGSRRPSVCACASGARAQYQTSARVCLSASSLSRLPSSRRSLGEDEGCKRRAVGAVMHTSFGLDKGRMTLAVGIAHPPGDEQQPARSRHFLLHACFSQAVSVPFRKGVARDTARERNRSLPRSHPPPLVTPPHAQIRTHSKSSAYISAEVREAEGGGRGNALVHR